MESIFHHLPEVRQHCKDEYEVICHAHSIDFCPHHVVMSKQVSFPTPKLSGTPKVPSPSLPPKRTSNERVCNINGFVPVFFFLRLFGLFVTPSFSHKSGNLNNRHQIPGDGCWLYLSYKLSI